MRARLRSMASRSTTRAGVSMVPTPWRSGRPRAGQAVRRWFRQARHRQVRGVGPATSDRACGVHSRRLTAVLVSCQVRGACSSCPVAARRAGPSRAMGHQHESARRMARRQLMQRACNALAHLNQRLAARRRPVRLTLAPAQGFFGPGGFDLEVGLAFEDAEPRSRKPWCVDSGAPWRRQWRGRCRGRAAGRCCRWRGSGRAWPARAPAAGPATGRLRSGECPDGPGCGCRRSRRFAVADGKNAGGVSWIGLKSP